MTKALLSGCLGLMIAPTLPGAGSASDYIHECATADGRYRLFDETLYKEEFVEGQGMQPVPHDAPFTVEQRITLEREEGYCAIEDGTRFSYEWENYVLKATLTENDIPGTVYFICNLAAEGRPAAITSCDYQKTDSMMLEPAYSGEAIRE